MPKFLLLVLCMLLVHLSRAQQLSIYGNVSDTSDQRHLSNAVVSLIRSADSVLLKFTRTAADGSFSIPYPQSGDFFLMVTFPGYADYVEPFGKRADGAITMGTIPLTKKSELLETVIFKQQIAAIRMKGDTLEFKADSFKVSQGASVDELLKRLPGIQVDRNGQITGQGQKVNKVLVDGEEFFSEDPAVVIKNLQAEAVKEVQVFDKKSEQAEFTGIDDGKRSKTINLTLKADKKKGYFVKAGVVGGTTGRFDNDLMANAFKGSRKIAAYAVMANTGRGGLDWRENEQFGGGNDIQFDEESGGMYVNNREDAFSDIISNNDGLPTAWSGGLHFSNKWNADKDKFNGNYRILKKNMEAEGSTFSQYILPDSQYFNNESRKTFSSTIGHMATGVYEMKFDSSSTLKLTVKGSTLNTKAASRFESSALDAESAFVNTNNRLLTNDLTKNNFSADLLWRKKFRKAGRTLSVALNQQMTDQDLDALLQSHTNFFNGAGDVEKQEVIDQKKNNNLNDLGIKSTIVYTEPLSKFLFLSVNYGFNYMRSESGRVSLNNNNGVYDKLDSLFSNDFRFRYGIQSAGVNLKFNRKKLVLILGSGISNSGYRQADLLKDSSRRYSFVNFYPKFSLAYNPTSSRRFSFSYNGLNNPPTLNQLQPVSENTDPLNLRLGNPALRQEFAHNFVLSASDFKLLSERDIYAFVTGNMTDNAISTSTVVDNGGKTTTQFINVSGNYSMRGYAGYGMKLKKPGIYVNFGADIDVARQKNRWNGLDNVNDNTTVKVSFSVRKNKNEKYYLSAGTSVGNTATRSSLRPDVTTNFITSTTSFDAWIKLPLKFEFYTEGTVNLRKKTDIFDRNNNFTKWDANIARKFLKNNNLELKFSVNDILDQNIGFTRSATSNIITESRNLTLRRYFLLGIHYNFSKNP